MDMRIASLGSPSITSPLVLAVIAFLLFTLYLDSPSHLYFDELRYVPAARQILARGVNENWSHPDFAKMLIASGIKLFGDHPLGWRFMSAVFGVVAVLGTYWLGLILFRDRQAAVLSAALVLFNQMLFVHARIATLDIFTTGFMIPAMALHARVWLEPGSVSDRQRRAGLGLAGFAFGLAAAAKWIAFVPLFASFCLQVFASHEGKGKRIRDGMIFLLGSAAFAYFLTLLPLLGMEHPAYAPKLATTAALVSAASPAPTAPAVTTPVEYGLVELLRLQLEMLRTHLFYFNPHPYYSPWYSWPIQMRTMWYHRDIWPDGAHESAVALIGNPVVLWVGILAATYAVARIWRRPSRPALFLVAMYFPLFVVWGALPRVASLLYYYLPSAVLLGPILVFAARELRVPKAAQVAYFAAVVAAFAFFYPLLANRVVTGPDRAARIWFSTWK